MDPNDDVGKSLTEIILVDVKVDDIDVDGIVVVSGVVVG
jgi:hypothetical protein